MLFGDMTNDDEKAPKAPAAIARTGSSPHAQEIDANLKRAYQATLEEKVPDRFHTLLAQLREKEGKAE